MKRPADHERDLRLTAAEKAHLRARSVAEGAKAVCMDLDCHRATLAAVLSGIPVRSTTEAALCLALRQGDTQLTASRMLALKRYARARGYVQLAKRWGMAPHALKRVLDGERVRRGTAAVVAAKVAEMQRAEARGGMGERDGT